MKKVKVGDVYHVYHKWTSVEREAIIQVTEVTDTKFNYKVLKNIINFVDFEGTSNLYVFFGGSIWTSKKVNIKEHPEYLL